MTKFLEIGRKVLWPLVPLCLSITCIVWCLNLQSDAAIDRKRLNAELLRRAIDTTTGRLQEGTANAQLEQIHQDLLKLLEKR